MAAAGRSGQAASADDGGHTVEQHDHETIATRLMDRAYLYSDPGSYLAGVRQTLEAMRQHDEDDRRERA